MNSMKHKSNYRQISYDSERKQYVVIGDDSANGGVGFASYREAREKKWQCEKCRHTVGSFKALREHKIVHHSY